MLESVDKLSDQQPKARTEESILASRGCRMQSGEKWLQPKEREWRGRWWRLKESPQEAARGVEVRLEEVLAVAEQVGVGGDARCCVVPEFAPLVAHDAITTLSSHMTFATATEMTVGREEAATVVFSFPA